MERVYILIEDDKYENGSNFCVYAFETPEKARQKLIFLKEKFMESNNIEDYCVDDNSDEELASFSAYKAGFYDENHFDLTVYQRDIL